MVRVGLTGGIASGKSTVGRMFVELGARLIDADAIVHDLFRSGEPVNQAVVHAFGDRVRAADGTIDRTVLGELVFNNSQARERLNSIVHPAVIQKQKDWLDDLASGEPNAVGIVDAALMIEVGTYRNYEKLIVVVVMPTSKESGSGSDPAFPTNRLRRVSAPRCRWRRKQNTPTMSSTVRVHSKKRDVRSNRCLGN